jgi:hypothetical protein
MQTSSFEFIQKATEALSRYVTRDHTTEGFWVNYGSFVINAQQPQSDIDFLYVHKGTGSVQRLSATFEGYPVTIYQLTERDLYRDGEEAKYGGYFAGKLLNPFVVISEDPLCTRIVMKTAGAFIGPFASCYGTGFSITPEQVLKDTILARLEICPWYSSYFLRYYIHLEFDLIWRQMTKVICTSLELSGHILQNNGRYTYQQAPAEDVISERKIASVARFWSLGSCLHGNMPDFPDFYIQKAKQYVESQKLQAALQEMMQFLRRSEEERGG